MERAVFVPDIDRLPPPGDPFDRLYLGSEFCVRRLPEGRGLRQALEAAAARGIAFSLVTPFLDEAGLAVTLALARALPEDASTEVVANDLGLIVKLRDAGWRGTLVAGRLLTRQRRGPGFQSFDDPPPGACEALQGSVLDSPAFVKMLGSTFGVRRFELDDLVQGIALPEFAADVRISLYRPWLLVTATRNCPWVFDGRTWDRSACARPCRGQRLHLVPPSRPGTAPAQGWRGAPQPLEPAACAGSDCREERELVLGGCAQFLEHRNVEPPPPAVDRIVWQPGIPA